MLYHRGTDLVFFELTPNEAQCCLYSYRLQLMMKVMKIIRDTREVSPTSGIRQIPCIQIIYSSIVKNKTSIHTGFSKALINANQIDRSTVQ